MWVRGAAGWSPLARFSFALAAILAVTAITLAAVTTALIGRYVETETAHFTEDTVASHFGTIIDEAAFERPLAPNERDRLEQTVVFHFSVYSILATRFYDRSGQVVFSYDRGEIGASAQGATRDQLQQTLAGAPPAPARREIVGNLSYATPRARGAVPPTHVAGEHTGGAAGQPDVRRTNALEAWVPVREDGEVIGGVVVSRFVEPIDAALTRIQLLSTGVIALAAILLWLVLRGVYARSSRQIVQQTVALEAALGETERTYDATLHALSSALDVRDTETEGHALRVVEYMELIAHELGIRAELYPTLRRGALLHDIGKIGVPDPILRKPGPLTDAEWVVMRQHPDIGAAILTNVPFLDEVATIVRAHHERWDGHGYPEGLAGDLIPLGARIFAVADSFDAMTSDRPYRRGRPLQEALGEIVGGRGTQFDPAVVDAFLQVERQQLLHVHRRAPRALELVAAS